VLLTAQALDLESTAPDRAAELAQEAHRIAPDFVPAAVIAGRILSSKGSIGRATRVLAKSWQYTPHPEIALAYAYVRPGDSPNDRLGRIKSLIVMTPDHTEARIALATAAVDARDWCEARWALEPLVEHNPTARVCALMARIEGGEKRDAGRVREWLARAVRAPRDPVWLADGVVSEEWQPISPITGVLDAFEWRVPPDRQTSGEGDPLLEEISELSRELESVARQISKAAADDGLAEKNKAKVEPTGPITITIKSEDKSEAVAPKGVDVPPTPAPMAKPVPAVQPVAPSAATIPNPSSATTQATVAPASTAQSAPAVKPAHADTATSMAPASTVSVAPDTRPQPAPKKAPEIFVPSRPPDDPGPEGPDFDDPGNAYTRFRSI
jgi:HemY protein